MRTLFNELWKNQRPLMSAGFILLILTGVLGCLMLFDQTQILGINRWIKPIKFSSSLAFYLFTVGIYLFFLQGFEKSKIIIAWGVILLMFGEIFLITMQSARGTTSHFNIANSFDGMVFSMMGFMIFINTLLIIYLTVLYFRADLPLPKAVVWGMRLGLIVFLLGSVQGGYMSSQTGHAVGIADGGAGLPLVNWSTDGGDLRVAHFLGLHALQIIPLVALTLGFLNRRISSIKPTAFTIIFAVLYFSIFTLVFAQALSGKPLIGRKIIVSESVSR
jgi:hypothetical protein